MRSVLAALGAAVLLVLFAAGCGGIDKGKLEDAIKSQTNDQFEEAQRPERVASVSCVKTSDDLHFRCDLEQANGSTLFVVRAECTNNGSCRWRRA